jgi:predicted RecB family nuclease
MLLAFNGLFLRSIGQQEPREGKIIFGNDLSTAKVRLAELIPTVEQDLANIITLLTDQDEKELCLNRHCSSCEYESHCTALAKDRDDLSLLRMLKKADIVKHNAKGIFTTKQLAYTFRPRRSRKKHGKDRPAKHDPSLQALAAHTDTIYVAEKPGIPESNLSVYLDIEGIPDRNFYYLIGLTVVRGDCHRSYSLWADERDDERNIWRSFLEIMETIGDCTIFHYGVYDVNGLQRLHQRYGGNVALVKRILSSCSNVIQLIYGKVYFPTFANDLKTVASNLGFRWAVENASGIQSLIWRYRWEATLKHEYKKNLLRYNRDDCRALEVVTDALRSLEQSTDTRSSGIPKAANDVEMLERAWPNIYKRNAFVLPALDRVNRCAYFDYQREKVLVRTSQIVRRSVRRGRRANQPIKLNKSVYCPRPSQCPKCGFSDVTKHAKTSKMVHDLKFMKGGIRRWTVQYLSNRFLCKQCGRTFLPPFHPSSSYGDNLRAWSVYQSIGLLRSNENIVEEMREIFGYDYPVHLPHRFKSVLASFYEPTFQQILSRIVSGPLIHADETKVSIKGRTCYVWAFTNLQEVAYIFTETREGDLVKELLKSFNGILISDFYSAYDSPNCAQQKFLIHLIRDLNDDLFKNPFDDELKLLASEFTELLVPIVETIDRYGLKKRHLNKHQAKVQRFFKKLLSERLTSEIAGGYQRRFEKYREKLFVFLRHDGIPWNNNNAENAVKRFAFLRRFLGGSSTEKGLKEYLILLSIRETLRRENISFLEFLRARENNLDLFYEKRQSY